MSTPIAKTVPIPNPVPLRRTLIAGWALIGIAVGHSLIGLAMSARVWPGWFTGDLHGSLFASTFGESELAFWSGPAGFPVPLLLLGLLAIGRARKGEAMPRYLAWVLAGWALFGFYVGFPSGFALFALPVPLLLLDAHRARKAA